MPRDQTNPARKGRPTLPESERASVAYNVRLTAAQHAKVQRLGGAQWIRDRIDRAKEQDGGKA